MDEDGGSLTALTTLTAEPCEDEHLAGMEGEESPALTSSSSAKKIGSAEPSDRWPIVAALLHDPDGASRVLIAALAGWAHRAHVHRIPTKGSASAGDCTHCAGDGRGLEKAPSRNERQSMTLAEDMSAEPLSRTQPTRPDGLLTPVSLD